MILPEMASSNKGCHCLLRLSSAMISSIINSVAESFNSNGNLSIH